MHRMAAWIKFAPVTMDPIHTPSHSMLSPAPSHVRGVGERGKMECEIGGVEVEGVPTNRRLRTRRERRREKEEEEEDKDGREKDTEESRSVFSSVQWCLCVKGRS